MARGFQSASSTVHPSPDGQRIAFFWNDSVVHVIGTDGSNRHRLDKAEEWSWSPDGREIVYSWRGRLYRIGAEGSNRRRLGNGSYPQWSPDGRKILYNQTRRAQFSIWVMDVDGSNRKLLARDSLVMRWVPG